MENKQKAIEKAYGEHWEAVKDYVDENGFVDSIHFPHGRLVADFGDNNGELACDFLVRPKSLQGIETNNGWIKIESEADLPKDDSVNYDMYNKNGRAISDLPLKTIIQLFEKGIITHYAIHVQRKPPIY